MSVFVGILIALLIFGGRRLCLHWNPFIGFHFHVHRKGHRHNGWWF